MRRDVARRNQSAGRDGKAPRRTDNNPSHEQPVRRAGEHRARHRVAPEPRVRVLSNQRDGRTQHNRHRPRRPERPRVEQDTPTTERTHNPGVIPRSPPIPTECQRPLPPRVARSATATLGDTGPFQTSSKCHIEETNHRRTDAESNEPTPHGRRTVQSTPSQTAKSAGTTREPSRPNTDRPRRGGNARQDTERHVAQSRRSPAGTHHPPSRSTRTAQGVRDRLEDDTGTEHRAQSLCPVRTQHQRPERGHGGASPALFPHLRLDKLASAVYTSRHDDPEPDFADPACT